MTDRFVMDVNTLGSRLRKIRGNQSGEKFAACLGVKTQTLYRYERDERTPPAEYFSAISKNVHVNMNWLLSGEGEMFFKSNSEDIQDMACQDNAYPLRDIDLPLAATKEVYEYCSLLRKMLEEERFERRELAKQNRELVDENRALNKENRKLLQENNGLQRSNVALPLTVVSVS